jgi:hypothetical protein
MAASDRWLEIDGISLDTNAWRITDLRPLYGAADVRGQDRLLPGVAGVVPYRRRRTVSMRALELAIFGDYDTDDEPTVGDFAAQCDANIAYLRANVADPTNVGDGTRTAVLHRADLSFESGQVHVVDFTFARGGPDWAVFTLGLSIPDGVLVEGGGS